MLYKYIPFCSIFISCTEFLKMKNSLDKLTYCFEMTGQLKTLFDHLGYLWLSHRPRDESPLFLLLNQYDRRPELEDEAVAMLGKLVRQFARNFGKNA